MRTAPLLLLGALLAGCVPETTIPVPRPGAGAPAAAVLEAEVHERINRHRASRGLPPLALDARLSEIARRHSQAMAEGRAGQHDGFEARTAEVEALFVVRSLAENVAYDSRADVAARVVEGWIASAPHRRNLQGDFDVTGVGVARARDGIHYLTQIFVARR